MVFRNNEEKIKKVIFILIVVASAFLAEAILRAAL